jgi:deoxyribodipyrimidine photo-lyase
VSYNYDFDIRHWRFIYESLKDLENNGLKLNILFAEALDVFKFLKEKYQSINVFSHEETGNDLTYTRDLNLKEFFYENQIPWNESANNMVIRGLKDRKTWDARWIKTIKTAIIPKRDKYNAIEIEHEFQLPKDILNQLSDTHNQMAKGESLMLIKNWLSF